MPDIAVLVIGVLSRPAPAPKTRYAPCGDLAVCSEPDTGGFETNPLTQQGNLIHLDIPGHPASDFPVTMPGAFGGLTPGEYWVGVCERNLSGDFDTSSRARTDHCS